jgi:hypothetical protein
MTMSSANTTETLDIVKKESQAGPGSAGRAQDRSSPDKIGADLDSVAQKEHLEFRAEAETQRLRTAKIKQSDLILFTTQLAVMLDSGVVLSDALDAITEQAEFGAFKTIITNVSEMIKGGENF